MPLPAVSVRPGVPSTVAVGVPVCDVHAEVRYVVPLPSAWSFTVAVVPPGRPANVYPAVVTVTGAPQTDPVVSQVSA